MRKSPAASRNPASVEEFFHQAYLAPDGNLIVFPATMNMSIPR
jgi:hypothetical protein